MPEWSDQHLRAVLLHEFAYLQRGDLWLQVVLQCIGMLLRRNPLYRLAARQNRVLREQACDDMVLNRFVDPTLYAQLLAESASRASPLTLGFGTVRMAAATSLHARVLMGPMPKTSTLTFSRR